MPSARLSPGAIRLSESMPSFKVVSTIGRLELTGDDGPDSAAYGSWQYSASLSGEAFDAQLQINDHLPQNFSAFFEDLSQNWKGWSGRKTYESLEPGLLIEATHDQKALCTLRVSLRPNLGTWCVTSDLTVEAGDLRHLAAQSKHFVK